MMMVMAVTPIAMAIQLARRKLKKKRSDSMARFVRAASYRAVTVS